MVNVLDEIPPSAMRDKWGWFVALGVFLLICGGIALGNLFIATVVSVYYIGMLMLVGGIIHLAHAFQVRGWEHILFWVLSGLLYTIAGILAFANPLLASEALTNAFRHANAGHVELEVIYQHDEFGICVRDDGVGIDEHILWRGSEGEHFGLVGMRERARRMRARLDIWTRRGAGTEVDLRISGGIAYAVKDPTRRRSPILDDHSR